VRPNHALSALTVILLFCAFSPAAQLAEDPLKNPGWVHFYNNEFPEAIDYFSQQLQARPQQAEAYNNLAQSILYLEMYRDGALESQLVSGTNPFLRRPKMNISAKDRVRFLDCIGHALNITARELQNDPNDAAALSASSVAHGLRSNFAFLVEKSWIDALRDAAAANKANAQILKIAPNFADAHLVAGLYEYIVGNLPFYMRALGFLGGFHGDREGGIKQLEFVRSTGARNRYDAAILLAVIYRRERRPRAALPLLVNLAATFPRNYFFLLEQEQMYSDLGDKSSALRILDEVEQLRAAKSPGYSAIPAEKIEYLRANLLFWYGDLNGAASGFQRLTPRANDLDLNTAVMSWLRLGQTYDLERRRDPAIEAYRQAIKTAPDSEAAAEARGYISHPYERKKSSG
jgi:tetratricopeptide (TPR) repeat protein